MSSLQKKETLLIVDDSKFQRVVIRQSLGEYFNFAEAVSGEECLTIMEKESDAFALGVKRRLQNSRDEQKAWKTKSQIDEMTSLFNKIQALYVSKKSGKGRYSVFGEENQTPDQKLQAFVWSSSRNVTSMLEFALPEFVYLKKVISVEEIRENMRFP